MTNRQTIPLAVLAVIVALLGYYLTTVSQPTAPVTKPVDVIAWVLPDGVVSIDGQRISDPVTLKAKLAALRKAGVEPQIHLRASKNMKFETIGKAVMLLQKADAIKVGFITEPRSVRADK